MTATFENTVGILVKAYLEGTLLKGNCCACAVGNICAAAAGYKISIDPIAVTFEDSRDDAASWDDDEIRPKWRRLFLTYEGDCRQTKKWLEPLSYSFVAEAYKEIERTGYTVEELAKVEEAFELAGPGYNEAAEFAGLMAVVDVLADIHGIDLATAEASKLLFVKA